MKVHRYAVAAAIFAIGEVVAFDAPGMLQMLVAVMAFAFLLYQALRNVEDGIAYFVLFTVLAYGPGNYETLGLEPLNFWGLRAGGVSLGVLYAIFLCMHAAVVLPARFGSVRNSANWPLMLFFAGSFLVGTVYLLSGVNYLDNYIADLKSYLMLPMYMFLLAQLNRDSIVRIVKYGVVFSVVGILLSFAAGRQFLYGQSYFVPTNALHLALPLIMVAVRREFSQLQYLMLLAAALVAFVFCNFFFSGKVMILLLLSSVILLLRYPKVLMAGAVTYLVLFGATAVIDTSQWVDSLGEGDVTAKVMALLQILEIIDLHQVAVLQTSIGNLVGELLSLVRKAQDSPSFTLFGYGLGGGINDSYGYLAPWAGASGYSAIDATRDNFFKMHLGIYEVFVKLGLVGMLCIAWLLARTFSLRGVYYVTFAAMLLLTFGVTKEWTLLTLILLRVCLDEKARFAGADPMLARADASLMHATTEPSEAMLGKT